jgi:hypothetical protein
MARPLNMVLDLKQGSLVYNHGKTTRYGVGCILKNPVLSQGLYTISSDLVMAVC